MEGFCGCVCGTCPTLCCFYFPAIMLSTLFRFRDDHFIHPTLRIGVSMTEWTIIILFHFYNVYQTENFLLREDRGRFLFIIGIVCFLIYSQYLSLLPKFILPLQASIRSKFGYAFNGELEELERLDLSEFSGRSKKEKVMSVYLKPGLNFVNDYILDFVRNELKISAKIPYLMDNKAKVDVNRFDIVLTGALGMSYEELRERVQQKVGDDGVVIFSPADEEIRDQYGRAGTEAPMAVFAYANGHLDIVEWLEKEHGARRHKLLFEYMADIETKKGFLQRFLDQNGDYFNQ